jgi:hypothetical protein
MISIIAAMILAYGLGVYSVLAAIAYLSKKEDAETNEPNLKK